MEWEGNVKNYGEFSKNQVVAWTVVSFFALDPEAQEGLFGEAEEWYCKERSQNKGANYLYGLSIVAIEYVRSLRDLFPDSAAEIDQFVIFLSGAPSCSKSDVWSIKALYSSSFWSDMRVIAGSVIRSIGCYLNPPKKPMNLESLIEVDTYSGGGLGGFSDQRNRVGPQPT